ncbi:MAG: O-antigen ligase family protein [Polyangia bacterium]
MTKLELALYALCGSATLALGSVHPETQVVLCGAAVALLLAASLSQACRGGVRVVPFGWVYVAALCWSAFQLVPLPLGVLRLVSPAAAALRAETGARFAPITLDGAATTLELCKQLAALCVFLVGSEVLRTRDVRRPAAILAWLGGVCAVLTWAHRWSGATRIYGFYTPHSLPGFGFFVPFVAPNNAASLFALTALCAIGVAVASRGARRVGYAVLSAALCASVLGTTSRGGAAGLAVGALVFLTIVASEQFGRVRGVALALGIMVVLGAGALVTAGGLRSRLVQKNPANSVVKNQKVRGWAAGLKLAEAYPLTGVGRGAFEAPIASEREDDESVRLVYPENIVVQLAAESGLLFGLGIIAFAIWRFVRIVRRGPLGPVQAALTAGVVAIGVHQLFDFGLEFPGLALPVALALSALAAGAEVHDKQRRKPRPRLRRARMVPVAFFGVSVCFLGASSCRHTLAVDVGRAQGARDPREVEQAIARHPASAELEMLAGEAAIRAADPSALRHLGRAMRLQPTAARAHVLAGVELERLHRYGQAALEFRLAAERGAPLSASQLVRRVGRYAIDAVPRTQAAYLALGAEDASRKRWDDAQEAYERAAALDPGPAPRIALLSWMPPERRGAVAELIEREAGDGAELALAVTTWNELGQPERAERVAASGLLRFPDSAPLVAALARVRMSHGDLEGARKVIGHTSRFEPQDRLALEELLVEVAQKSGDLDQAAAARARLRLLRAKVDFEQPSGGGTP